MKPNARALFPFIVFTIVFILLNIVYYADAFDSNNFALFAGFIALITSSCGYQKKETFNEHTDIFIAGASQSIVMHMCSIFFLSTALTTILEHTGSITSAVHLSLQIIPTWFLLPGMFITTSIFSFIVGTSMGAITAFMPIAHSIAIHMGFNPSLIAATITCGAIFGDNLSILSDTTITAVKMTGTTMTKKFILNTKIALPAFICSICILAYQNYLYTNCNTLTHLPSVELLDLFKILPYLLSFYLAFIGLDIIVVMMFSIIFALTIGLLLQCITPIQAINLLFDGFYNSKEMLNVSVLVILLSGLSQIIMHNGGIEYIIEKFKKNISNIYHAKFALFCLVTIINVTLAANTIAIMLIGPVAKQVGEDFKIDAAEVACILDIGSCVMQGLLPYTPQLLLAASLSHVSTISLLPYLYYQMLLLLSLLLTIILKVNISIRK